VKHPVEDLLPTRLKLERLLPDAALYPEFLRDLELYPEYLLENLRLVGLIVEGSDVVAHCRQRSVSEVSRFQGFYNVANGKNLPRGPVNARLLSLKLSTWTSAVSKIRDLEAG